MTEKFRIAYLSMEVGLEARLPTYAGGLGVLADDTLAALDPGVLTLGFARRATAYKRATLLFRDPERLRRIAEEAGPIQLVFAGRAHPRDGQGKAIIEGIHRAARELSGSIRCVYLPDYDMALGAAAERVRGDGRDAEDLYEVLSQAVIPTVHEARDRFEAMMRYTISLNGAFFNAQRMVWQYMHGACGLRGGAPRSGS